MGKDTGTASMAVLLRTVFFTLLLLLSACGPGFDPDPDPDEEGGVIGTGIILKGTVSDTRTLASNSIEIKSRSGEISTVSVNEFGRYAVDEVVGTAPFLLRADFGNGDFRYGISYGDGLSNLHSYSDVILRNWYVQNNQDIAAGFDNGNELAFFPNQNEFNTVAAGLFELVDLVLASYDIEGSELLYASFDANNSGIDNYLDKNPVIIDDQVLSVIITDPESSAQSTTQSLLRLGEISALDDEQAPLAPTAVKALGSASNEMIVVWDPAIDNVGVVGYQIFRDQQLISTTPFPVYTDTGLDLNTSYQYEVVAFDAAGNESPPSVPAFGETLFESDVIPPPSPSNLMLTPGISRVSLIWGQRNVADVVAFQIYRGLDANALLPLVRVTSTFVTDISAAAGTRYCYRVDAIDASGNESEPGEVACVVTEGITVVVADTGVPEEISQDEIPTLADLQIPNTLNMDCDTQLVRLTVEQNTLLDDSCYEVIGDLIVTEPANLSIAAGTVLKFSSGAELTVRQGASLSSAGTKQQPIVFTGIDPTPGFWDGIVIDGSNSSRNVITNSVVEFGGGGRFNAGIAVHSVAGVSSLELTDSLISDSSEFGFALLGTMFGQSKFEGNVVRANESSGVSTLEGVGFLSSMNDFTGNDNDLVRISSVTVNQDIVVKGINVPYALDFVQVNNLHLLAGVNFEFETGGELLVNGFFQVDGTQEKPVTLSGKNRVAGSWGGLLLRGGGTVRNITVEHGGSGTLIFGERASLHMIEGSYSIRNSKISNGLEYGLIVGSSARLNDVDRITVTGNDFPMRADIVDIESFDDNSSFSGNSMDLISLTSTKDIDSNLILKNLGVSYLSETSIIVRNWPLVIRPGVVLLMAPNTELVIESGSSISILGESDDRVRLASAESSVGPWVGIRITGSAASIHQIQYSDIDAAGIPTGFGSGAIDIFCGSSLKNLNIRQTSISNSASWGIHTVAGNCVIDIDDTVLFLNNVLGDIGNN